MRHFIAARPVTTRSLGMGEPPSAAGLVAPSGGVLLAAPRSLRAVAGAVDLAAVATAADHCLGATVRAKKQSSRRRVTAFGPANAKWTDATIARIMPLHACPARCGARRRGETAKLGSAPCSPSKTSKPYPAIRPASAQASPKGQTASSRYALIDKQLSQATLASIPIRRTLSQPESELAPSKRGFSPPLTTVVATVRAMVAGKVERECRTFATTTAGLSALLAWLTEARCSHVAMEATGVFWKPVWNVLSDGAFELIVANALTSRMSPAERRTSTMRRGSPICWPAA